MENDYNECIISLINVDKCYKTGAGDLSVLRDISLDIQAGDFVSVVGPSGSGKSTLLNMITGIDRPSKGDVVVGGQDLNQLNENQMARWRGRSVGVIFQFFQLLPSLTILENVVMPMEFCRYLNRKERKHRALNLLGEVGMSDHANKFPHALSGGEQQRVAIARALATDPPIIVADEPTGNLDGSTASDVFLLFRELVKKGKTLLLVTHDADLSSQTRRIISLVDGQIYGDEINYNHFGRQKSTQKEIHKSMGASTR